MPGDEKDKKQQIVHTAELEDQMNDRFDDAILRGMDKALAEKEQEESEPPKQD